MISLGQDLAELIVEPKPKPKNKKKTEDTDFYNLWRVNPNEPPQSKTERASESEKKTKVYVNIVQDEQSLAENTAYLESNSRLKQMALLRQQRQAAQKESPETIQEQQP